MNGNVIRTITIRGQSEGLDKLTADVNKLASAQENVAVVSEQSAKRVLSLEDAWKKQTLRLDEAARAQANIARETKIADAALREGLATQAQHARALDQINQKYGQATVAQKAFSAATSGVSAQLVALSAGAGPVGVFLSALGPWGIAASVGLGAVASVFDRISEGAKRVGDKSIELKKFSDVTGLSVMEIKGLTKAGAEMGVSSDDIKTSIEHLSVGLAEAHKGTGDLFNKVREINPALAEELIGATTTAKGFDVLAQALKGATDASQRNALARVAFGRGGLETGQVAISSADQGGVAAMGDEIARTTGLTKEWVDETRRLRQENIELEKAISNTMDAAYALPALQRQNEWLKKEKEIADLALKRGGITAPAAEDYGAAFVSYATPPDTTQQRQQEANAIRDAADQQQRLNDEVGKLPDLLDQTINKEKERLGLLGSAATAQDRINLKTWELDKAVESNIITLEERNRALAATVDAENARSNGIDRSTSSTSNNARATESATEATQTWTAANDDAVLASNRITDEKIKETNAYYRLVAAINAANDALREQLKFVPTLAWLGSQGALFKTRDGGYSQFNPAGYQSSYDPGGLMASNVARAEQSYGKGGFDITYIGSVPSFVPNDSGRAFVEEQKNKAFEATVGLATKGGNFSGINDLIARGGIFTGGESDPARLQAMTRAIDLLTPQDQIAPLQGIRGQLQGLPQTIETAELIKQLNDKLTQLTTATDANTSATSAMTDVLSPFYSQDPRQSHLGFRAFAGGGIMSQYGELPIRHYQGGGMATSPQVAVFGEGSTPEAYVPVPSGRIPVEMRGMPAANNNQRPVRVTINIMGNASPSTVAALKATAFQQAQAMRKMTG